MRRFCVNRTAMVKTAKYAARKQPANTGADGAFGMVTRKSTVHAVSVIARSSALVATYELRFV